MKIISLSSLFLGVWLSISACSLSPFTGSGSNSSKVDSPPLIISSVPDQDGEILTFYNEKLAAYLEKELSINVEYHLSQSYESVVKKFVQGEVSLVWFGALTGVQARTQVQGAEAIAQRDLDVDFRSVFIANKEAGVPRIQDVDNLILLKEYSLIFGSKSSTSSRLMPQFFLEQAGIQLRDFQKKVGFAGPYDNVIRAVEKGDYDVGILNEQVWNARVQQGVVDLEKVNVIWRTPAYYNYHWVIHPNVTEYYGEEFMAQVQNELLAIHPGIPEQKEILDFFDALRFIPTRNANYYNIEKTARQLNLLYE